MLTVQPWQKLSRNKGRGCIMKISQVFFGGLGALCIIFYFKWPEYPGAFLPAAAWFFHAGLCFK